MTTNKNVKLFEQSCTDGNKEACVLSPHNTLCDIDGQLTSLSEE